MYDQNSYEGGGGRGGGWECGSSERCLKVGWWRWEVIKRSFQKHLKTKVVCRGRGFEGVTSPAPPPPPENFNRTPIHRAGGSGPTTPTMIGPNILPFAAKVLYSQKLLVDQNNCVVEVFSNGRTNLALLPSSLIQ